MRPKHAWFLAFAAAFAALAGFVFWGTWSLDFAPVMPDDTIVHSMAYGDHWANVVNAFWTKGRFIPSDVFWRGLLISPYFCQELKYAASLFLAGLGVAYYCRGRGLSHLASYGAGLLLSFCGYWASLFSAGHGGWFVWMMYGVFAFGLADRAVRKNKLKNWLLLGACVGWSGIDQPDLWLLFTLFTGLYFVWCCIRERKLPWKGALISAVAFFAVGTPGLIAAAGSKEGREKQIDRGETIAPNAAKDEAEKRWIFVTNWSLPTDETAEFFIPRINGDTSCPLTLSVGARTGSGIKPYTGALGRPKDAKEGNYRQHCLYVGWITCILALLGILFGVVSRRAKGEKTLSSDVPFFLGAALLCWLLSLGRYCEPLYRCVFALPIGDSIRCPVKWHHLTEFALAVLAAYGIEGLSGFLGRMKPLATRIPNSYFLIPLILLGAFDVARVDKIFCAPVDLRQVRKTNSNMQMSVLRRQDFANPHVAEMVKGGRIVSLANYLGNPDLFLVEVLTPRDPTAPRKPLPPMTGMTWIGFVALCASLGIGGYAFCASMRKRRSAACGRPC